MVNRCIVNVAVGDGFLRGQDRLARSLAEVGYVGGVAFWRDEYPPGSPRHEDMPYAFKAYALECVAQQGYTSLLWVDASVWFVRPPSVVFDEIEREGHYVAAVVGEHSAGQWCSDDAVVNLGTTREELMSYPLVYGGFFGVEISRRTSGWVVLYRFGKCARDGSFCGPWGTDASADSRVKGHRHDQTALSAIVGLRGLKIDQPPSMFAMDAHEKQTERTVAVCRGLA